MPLKHAAWIHGTSVQFENQSWAVRALRQGAFTTVTPSNEATSGWVHFAIPTPVIVNDVRLKAQSALIRFSTGPQASVGAVHVWDGETNIYERNGVNYKGNLQFIREVIPNQPEVKWGINISILLNFNGRGPDAWVQLISAGIDFF
jgi:hypothetical protein